MINRQDFITMKNAIVGLGEAIEALELANVQLLKRIEDIERAWKPKPTLTVPKREVQ